MALLCPLFGLHGIEDSKGNGWGQQKGYRVQVQKCMEDGGGLPSRGHEVVECVLGQVEFTTTTTTSTTSILSISMILILLFMCAALVGR